MATTATVETIRSVLDTAYPPRLAESWDRVGLICGDPEAKVDKVAFALECTQQVAERAVEIGADMLVVHHPLLLRGTSTVAADTPKGKVLHTLIRGGVALFAAHTNADAARPGVNDRLAELLGVHPGAPIVAAEDAGGAALLDHWGVHVPPADLKKVTDALFAAGAGEIGDYSHCAFAYEGTGQFRPDEGADPTEGEVGELYSATETRVVFTAPRARRRQLITALRAAHPYEEPAFDIVEMAPTGDPETLPGLGRVGELDRPMPLKEFVQRVPTACPRPSGACAPPVTPSGSCAGWPSLPAPATASSTPCAGSTWTSTSPPTCATTPSTSTCAPRDRPWWTPPTGPASSPGRARPRS